MYTSSFHTVYMAVIGFAFLCIPLLSSSKKYSKQWKKVDKAMEQELPKTALQHLDRIIAYAQRDDNTQQLLKAMITRLQVSDEISEDSAKAMLPQIEHITSTQSNPADRQIWNMVTGWLYARQNLSLHPEYKDKAINAFTLATSDAPTLGAVNSKQYIAVLQKGKDSRYYNNDMLSVAFPFVAEQLKNLYTPQTDSLSRLVMEKEIAYYQAQGNRPATLLAKIDSINFAGNNNADAYQRLIEEYQDLPLVAGACLALANMSNAEQAYEIVTKTLKQYPKAPQSNSLKNKLSEITQPTIECIFDTPACYPGKSIKIDIFHRNVSEVTISYTKLPYAASDKKLYELTTKDYEALSRTTQFKTTLQLKKAAPYERVCDTIDFNIPQSGIYLVTLQSPNTETGYEILHASSLSIIQLPLPRQKTRICIVDKQNGRPIANAHIKLKTTYEKTPIWTDHTADHNGELIVNNSKGYTEIFASTETDNSLPSRSLAQSYNYRWNFNQASTQTKLYTDRSIYRPGQTVKVGGIVFYQHGDSTVCLNQADINIELYDSNYKLIESSLKRTDDFGSFGTEFVLPKECLNGTFHIRSKYGSTSFSVEEYKRPTFQVTLNKPDTTYTLGDTIYIKGNVATFTGQPLANTKVYCHTVRNKSYWFYSPNNDTPYATRDTVTTDDQGNFCIPVVLSFPAEKQPSFKHLFYTYTLQAKATALDGETQENSIRIYAGNSKAWVNTNMPDVVCKEQMPEIMATQSNNMGKTVDGKGSLIIAKDGNTIYTQQIQYNRKGQFDFVKSLPSGEYTLTLAPTDETDKNKFYTKTFTIISRNDTKTTGHTPLQIWSSGRSFKDDKQKVDILVGIPLQDTWLRYDLVANNKLIESKLIHVSDTILHFSYTYQEAYGNGLHILFAMLNNGKLHHESIVLTKPVPNKSLNIRWTTFRNKLTPGAEETWIMQVTKDSIPVKASVLATMYDASLNKFGAHSLSFGLNYNRFVPQQQWEYYGYEGFMLHCYKPVKKLRQTELEFTIPDPQIFSRYGLAYARYPRRFHLLAKGLGKNSMVLYDRVESEPLYMVSAKQRLSESFIADSSAEVDDAESMQLDTIKQRTNFNETAFFSPSIKTNDKGEARLEFILPESITSWDFHAIAHTKELDYATIDTTIIVEKPFSLHANVPRFLRNSDKTSLSVSITNNSEKMQSGKARLTIINAQTGAKIKQLTEAFKVNANQSTVVNFQLTIPENASLLICHTAAISQEFTDAEQQYIPILPSMYQRITTVPFALTDSSTYNLSLKDLDYQENKKNARLTFEYTANPLWTVLTAMPSTINLSSPCATTLASNFASLTMMRKIIEQRPQIKSVIKSWQKADTIASPLTALENNEELKKIVLSETPWVQNAYNERRRLNELMLPDETLILKQTSLLDKLKAMQTGDGGWQWFPGMQSNLQLTVQITEMLLKAKSHAPELSPDVTPLVDKAFKYLDRLAVEQVKSMRKSKLKEIPATWLHYVYVATIAGHCDSQEYKYMLKHIEDNSAQYNLYDKAISTYVLQATNRQKEAQQLANSLIEHTVYRKGVGRYFDSAKAPSSWSMYRIPIQVKAIEALQAVYPQKTAEINEMKQWLLTSKHAQMWNNPLTSIEAVGCLLSSYDIDTTATLPAEINIVTKEGKNLSLTPFIEKSSLEALGYVKADIPISKIGSAPEMLVIKQRGASPLAYGALYLTTNMPASQVKSSGSDLSLSRTLYKEITSGWVPVREKDILSKGDRIKALYTIEASRDLDFVSLKASRAACMEPVSTHSGYQYGGYCSVEDASTTWFYDKLSKGTHTVEEIYNVDRTGVFTTAPAEAQCLYAPEFTATSNETTLHVK